MKASSHAGVFVTFSWNHHEKTRQSQRISRIGKFQKETSFQVGSWRYLHFVDENPH